MREEGLGSREPPESLGRGAASAPHRKTYLSKEIPGKFPGTKLQAGNDFRKHPYHLPEIYVKPKLVLQVVGRVDGDRRTPDPTPPLENRRSRIPASYRRFPGRRAASSRTRGPRSRGRRTRVSTRVRCAVGVQRFRALGHLVCLPYKTLKLNGVRLRTKLINGVRLRTPE